ncbi:5-oxoprolinase subunit PxpB [Litchfieldia alkalitelluris]|uniref:5-oxoprolinase subunit PxpB n=1 Tax=Litchfieldia alkalitelluris TaxID=304268 RepID=UPI0009987D29|nr:5-oxoprolinase subunit PxpB [Litchfieldia alkalitelluris]
MEYKLSPLGDQAIVIELGESISLAIHDKVKQLSSIFDTFNEDWFVEYIPAFATITIFYDPVVIVKKYKSILSPYEYVCENIKKLIVSEPSKGIAETRTIQVPVCYEGEYAPDLLDVASYNQLTPEEVVKIHTSGDYTVYMIGFAPGFPYVGGMSGKIATPRKATPRLKIPAGSVGIAGEQTGIYPLETPGGWQIIGRTPLQLFQPNQESPSLLRAGDKLQFFPITSKDYENYGGVQHVKSN